LVPQGELMKIFSILAFLPALTLANTFEKVGPKIGFWSGTNLESYFRDLDSSADSECKQRLETKSLRVGDYGFITGNGLYYFLSGTYTCQPGPFTLATICGPFGGCLGNEEALLDEMALDRCLENGFDGAMRVSKFRYQSLKLSAKYSCHYL
jgi:hypothetical protein